MAEEAALPPPVVLALVLTESRQYDSGLSTYSLFNTLPGFESSAFPTRITSLCVYAALTNGRGETVLTFRLVDVDERRRPVFNVEMSVTFPDPTHVAELMFITPGLSFQEAGEYHLQTLADGKLLAERRLKLMHSTPSAD